MSQHLIELDHIMLRVPDLGVARRAWQRLGFTVSPYRASEPMGGGKAGGRGGNHLVCMTPVVEGTANFVELAYADPARAQPTMRALLSGPPGFALMVHAASDVDALARDWEAAGAPPAAGFFDLDSTYEDPETGRVDRLSFRVSIPTLGVAPLELNAYSPRDLTHYLREDWRTHANGALRWRELTVLVADDVFEAASALFERLYPGAVERRPGLTVATPRKLTWRLARRETMDGLFAAGKRYTTVIGVEVANLERTAAALSENAVPFVRAGATLIADVPELEGNAVVFRTATTGA